mmetsp:Transcript_1362/g.2681  ORF Transcript_1362/g.2681 Transcript_1362/m.2681 type:complete len:284 (-) Transcript_1362:2033-2884(-)
MQSLTYFFKLILRFFVKRNLSSAEVAFFHFQLTITPKSRCIKNAFTDSMPDDPRDSAVHPAVLEAAAASGRIAEGNSEDIDRDGLAFGVVVPVVPAPVVFAEEAPAAPDSAWVHPSDPIDSASVEPGWEDLLRHADKVANIPVADNIRAVVLPDRHWVACFHAEEVGRHWEDILRLRVRLVQVRSLVEEDRVVPDPVRLDDLPLEVARRSWKGSIRVLDLGWMNRRCVRRWIVLLSRHRCEVFPKFRYWSPRSPCQHYSHSKQLRSSHSPPKLWCDSRIDSSP